MIVVDASVWVSWLVEHDAHHAQSRRWMRERVARGDRIAIPGLTLAEVAGAVSRRTTSPMLGHQAARGMMRLSALQVFASDRRIAITAARVAADLKLRGADATYVALAHVLEAPLVTWDQEQAQRASAMIVVVPPIEP